MVVNKRKGPIATINPPTFTEQLKQTAHDLGFVLCGVTPAAAPLRLEAFTRWLAAGYAGQMHYLESRQAAYAHPRHVLDGCRSLIMLALPYATTPVNARTPTSRKERNDSPQKPGRVAAYALGEADYHDVIQARLKRLKEWVLEHYPHAAVRGVVDTAPLLEREMAEAAGRGWVGTNTLLLNRRWGSYFFLAALLTDLELTADEPNEKGFCGTCTACLDACPTQAFPKPFVLDANKCISYLTIEHRDEIEDEFKGKLDGWVFGCDICQTVCPWNRKAEGSSEAVFSPRRDLAEFDILAILDLSDDEFRVRFRKTPLWRSKRRGLLRNAILVAGSTRMPDAYEAVCRLLADHEALIRSAAVWAISQFEDKSWRVLLQERLLHESDPQIVQAIHSALFRKS